MKLSFLGAASVVTGSKFLIEEEGVKILVDCGLFQGLKELRKKNWRPLSVEASQIDAILLTHAHIDHSGYIPRLVRDGFKGIIYCTPATLDLAKILLPDCAHIMREDASYANKNNFYPHSPAQALYDTSDVEKALSLFQTINYDEEFLFKENIFVTFINAGHILGSSSILVENKRKGIKVGFSGDLGRPNHPILEKPNFFKNLNYLVLESTYGDRTHSKLDPIEDLSKIINEAIEREGSILIPAFAVGRTQSLLFYLSKILDTNKIPNIPIFLDSPMASNVSGIYCRYSYDHKLTDAQCKHMCSAVKFVKSTSESIALNKKKSPMIIISASGMATGGRVLHHLKKFAPDEKNTLLFTGYQAPGTRGKTIVEGASAVKIHGEMWPIRAKVVNCESMSAHADQNDIMSWLHDSKISPKKVFIVHGEKESSTALSKTIEKELTWKTFIPKLNDSVTL